MALIWSLMVTFGRVLTGMVVSSFEFSYLDRTPFLFALIQSLLLVLPFAVISQMRLSPLYRGIFRALAFSSLFAALAAPIHLTKPFSVQLHAVLHIAVSALYILLVWLVSNRDNLRSLRAVPSRSIFPALITAAVFAAPWLAWGALGSLLDTLLQALAALAFGLGAAMTIQLHIFPALLEGAAGAPHPRNTLPRFILAGFSAGLVILIFVSGSAFGYHVMQLLLMISMPALGFPLAGWALLHPTSQHSSLLPSQAPPGGSGHLLLGTLLVGLSAAAPMALIDPAELILLASLGPGELLQWALSAALLSAFLALMLGLVLLAVLVRQSKNDTYDLKPTYNSSPGGLPVLAGLSVLGGLLVFLLVGQPGFHGDGLFVILENQFDPAVAAQLPDPAARREAVYQGLTAHASAEQASIRAALDQFNIEYTPYYLVNGLVVSGGPLLHQWLEGQPGVDRVLNNPWMRPLPGARPLSTGQTAGPIDPPWNLEQVGADRARDVFGVTGEGVIIGQSDSGVQWDHPELIDSYRGYDPLSGAATHGYNWLDPWYASPEPVDAGGHGTHTLGTIIGKQVGVAPGAKWYGCANLSRNLGNPALYLECMQFMLAPYPPEGDPFNSGRPDLGAQVINNSWSCPEVEGCDTRSLLHAIEALRAAGVFVVVSAGNNGPACGSLNEPPAIYPGAFSVGAVDHRGELAYFSSIGDASSEPASSGGSIKPDLAAPGVEVLSSMPGSTYGTMSGTSMAGPHVTGVVALMWSANPGLVGNIERTEQILRESASPFRGELPPCHGADAFPSTAVGYGVLDAYRAVELALREN